jgi:archaetidylinositol phosphate synthase
VVLADFDDAAERAFGPVAASLERIGATPNQVSVVSFGVAVGAAVGFYFATPVTYAVGALLVAFSGVLDIVDGQLARRTGESSAQGDMLDHTLDRYSDLALLVGIAGGLEAWALGLFAVTGVFLTSYMGTQAQAVGAGRDYGGLLGRADRLAFIVVAGALHPLLPLVAWTGEIVGFVPLEWLLVVFAVVGNLTALQRFWASWKELS